MLESELVHQGLRADAARGELLEKIAGKLNYSNVTDLYAAIGFGDANAASIAKRLKEELKADNVVDIQTVPRPTSTRRVARNASGIRIAGVDDVLVRLSKCCSPVPGDPIMGFVTIGRGVSVHRADCPERRLHERGARAHPRSDLGRRHAHPACGRHRDRSRPTARACSKT